MLLIAVHVHGRIGRRTGLIFLQLFTSETWRFAVIGLVLATRGQWDKRIIRNFRIVMVVVIHEGIRLDSLGHLLPFCLRMTFLVRTIKRTSRISETFHLVTTDPQGSIALQSILGPEGSISDFFEQIWQKECKIFRAAADINSNRPSETSSTSTAAVKCPLHILLNNSWPALITLMQEARGRFTTDVDNNTKEDTTMHLAPIFFSHGTPVSPDAYNNSLFHAYLDSCSIVINHADTSSAELAQLCLDFMPTRRRSVSLTLAAATSA